MKFFNFEFPLTNSLNILIFTILIFIISWIVSRIIRFFMVLYLKKSKGKTFSTTSVQFLKNSIKFIIFFLALIVIIIEVPSIRSKALLIFSGAGILAAIIGFAAQSAISNLIAGTFIVIFKPFRVGDYIKLDEQRKGIVEDINLRHTTINNFENKRVIIPNSIISTESVLNHNIQDSHVLSFNNFYVGTYADIDKARSIIIEEGEKVPLIIPNKVPNTIFDEDETIVVRVISIEDNVIHLRAYAWVANPLLEFKVKSILREAVHKRFIKEEIDIPKNHNHIIYQA